VNGQLKFYIPSVETIFELDFVPKHPSVAPKFSKAKKF